MTIYVLERDNPEYRPNPEVFLDGNKALEKVRSEYCAQMREFGTTQEESDSGYGIYGCYWNFSDNSSVGDCVIDCDCDSDRYGWRITKHEIEGL